MAFDDLNTYTDVALAAYAEKPRRKLKKKSNQIESTRSLNSKLIYSCKMWVENSLPKEIGLERKGDNLKYSYEVRNEDFRIMISPDIRRHSSPSTPSKVTRENVKKNSGRNVS